MLKLTVVVYMILGILNSGFCLESSTAIPSSTVRPLRDKFSPNDAIMKRNIKFDDISGKSYNSQPEYYRPGSSYDRNRDRNVVGYNNGAGGSSNNGAAGIELNSINGARPSSANSYGNDNKLQQKAATHSSYSDAKSKTFGDRLGLGSYGGGHSIPVDFSGHYGTSGGGVGSSSHGYDHDSYDYGNDYGKYGGNGGYSSYGQSGYGGGGGGDLYNKVYLAKKILLPLAGVAALGVAAVLIANPLLLNLGTVASPFGKKRKRRDLEIERQNKDNHLNLAQDMAYKGYEKDIQ